MTTDEGARRRDQIVNLLSAYGELSAKAMADMLAVTVQTVRADLRALDDAAVVRRRHGSARLAVPAENIGYLPRMSVSRSEKDRIGAAVAGLLPDGASVALGTGTTVEAVARACRSPRTTCTRCWPCARHPASRSRWRAAGCGCATST